MTLFRRYERGDQTKVGELALRSAPLVAIDPGREGVALFWERSFDDGPWPRVPDHRRSLGPYGSGASDVAELAVRLGVGVAVVEDQFLGKNPKAMATLVFNAGLVVGALVERARPAEVVLVHPATWQARLPKVAGARAKERAVDAAVRALGSGWLLAQGDTPTQQAVADAFGLATWYEEVTREAARDSSRPLGW